MSTEGSFQKLRWPDGRCVCSGADAGTGAVDKSHAERLAMHPAHVPCVRSVMRERARTILTLYSLSSRSGGGTRRQHPGEINSSRSPPRARGCAQPHSSAARTARTAAPAVLAPEATSCCRFGALRLRLGVCGRTPGGCSSAGALTGKEALGLRAALSPSP